MKSLTVFIITLIYFACTGHAQNNKRIDLVPKTIPAVLYGTSSFYANKFEGRMTANGEIFSQKRLTAACNVLPLGMWIRVTNLHNGRSVVVKVNDRLHYRMKRVTDLSKTAARQIGFNDGLIKVKVETLGMKKPTS